MLPVGWKTHFFEGIFNNASFVLNEYLQAESYFMTLIDSLVLLLNF